MNKDDFYQATLTTFLAFLVLLVASCGMAVMVFQQVDPPEERSRTLSDEEVRQWLRY